ncbi:T9SS type A sorting domain-containing protein [Pseudofulvibacter geojedonensis]|uniref:T9SS type A sorting domain-containing protein n=1 Tax=Pseudofulvibacter geojedonensis TaxID=1123758 RepID=A0ABW3HZY9_9FLAO
MGKITTFLICISYLLSYAQDGNTISTALVIDGSDLSVNLMNNAGLTASNLTPICTTDADIFYKHIVSSGDNYVTIGMSSASISIGAKIDFQILRAPLGDINNLEEVTCADYNIPLILGGSFEQVIDNINANDEFYLRVFKPSQSSMNLLSGTRITMTSEFNSTLSNQDNNLRKLEIVVKDNSINLINNSKYNNYKIFNLLGALVKENNINEAIKDINISGYNNGMYVLILSYNNEIMRYKFIKRE